MSTELQGAVQLVELGDAVTLAWRERTKQIHINASIDPTAAKVAHNFTADKPNRIQSIYTQILRPGQSSQKEGCL